MLVKFIACSTGSAQAAAAYLTRETDSQGAVRDDVAVLRGDPHQVAAVAEGATGPGRLTRVECNAARRAKRGHK